MRFDGKAVLVTGASRGIGREVARQFAEQGGTIAVHYKQNVDAARSTLKMLSGDGHRDLLRRSGKSRRCTIAGQFGRRADGTTSTS